jgi:hypothetical protein
MKFKTRALVGRKKKMTEVFRKTHVYMCLQLELGQYWGHYKGQYKQLGQYKGQYI